MNRKSKWPIVLLACLIVTSLLAGCSGPVSSAAGITSAAATTVTTAETTATTAVQDFDIEGLTIADLPTILFDASAVDWENDKIWLIAVLPEHNISMYGLNFSGGEKPDKGTVLVYWKDRFFKYTWSFLTPRAILPVLACADYDADNELEIAVDLYVGSGTGFSVENSIFWITMEQTCCTIIGWMSKNILQLSMKNLSGI